MFRTHAFICWMPERRRTGRRLQGEQSSRRSARPTPWVLISRPWYNAIHETNDRSERIERRFEQTLDVAAKGAEIATGLQAHAAEFLVKFEAAASDNDRSAARAIWLGAVAVVIALAMPVVQILYTELWRVPLDSASMEAVITDMQTEIATPRQTQIEAADRLAATLERSDQQLVEAVREFAKPMDAPPPAPIEEQPPAE